VLSVHVASGPCTGAVSPGAIPSNLSAGALGRAQRDSGTTTAAGGLAQAVVAHCTMRSQSLVSASRRPASGRGLIQLSGRQVPSCQHRLDIPKPGSTPQVKVVAVEPLGTGGVRSQTGRALELQPLRADDDPRVTQLDR
jgi:hypothetical protein